MQAMKLVLYLSGEHESLPLAEAESVFQGEMIDYSILSSHDNRVLFEIESNTSDFLKRLSLTKKVVRIVGEIDEKSLVDELAEIISEKTFRVSSSDKKTEGEFGGKLVDSGLKVDLDNPGVNVVVDDELIGIEVPLNRDFESRKPQHRPYFHPTSMHPKIARALVNLACVKIGDLVLDPFCGTGGILIEAGLMNMRVKGLDLDERMVEGCRKNLAHYGILGEVSSGDALEYATRVDAIVTDPPYGQGSYSGGLSPEKLVSEFIANASGMLKVGGRLVVVTPHTTKLKPKKLEKIEEYDIRVHKSLTRRINVFEKII